MPFRTSRRVESLRNTATRCIRSLSPVCRGTAISRASTYWKDATSAVSWDVMHPSRTVEYLCIYLGARLGTKELGQRSTQLGQVDDFRCPSMHFLFDPNLYTPPEKHGYLIVNAAAVPRTHPSPVVAYQNPPSKPDVCSSRYATEGVAFSSHFLLHTDLNMEVKIL